MVVDIIGWILMDRYYWVDHNGWIIGYHIITEVDINGWISHGGK